MPTKLYRTDCDISCPPNSKLIGVSVAVVDETENGEPLVPHIEAVTVEFTSRKPKRPWWKRSTCGRRR